MPTPEAPAALRIVTSRAVPTGEDGLEGVNTHELAQGAIILVGEFFYRLDRSSTATADGVSVVAPLIGPGRWIRMGSEIVDVPFEENFAPGGNVTVGIDVSDLVPITGASPQANGGIFLRVRLLGVYRDAAGAWDQSALTQLESNLNYDFNTFAGTVRQAGGSANVSTPVEVMNTWPDLEIGYGASAAQQLNFTITDTTAVPPGGGDVHVVGYYSLFSKMSELIP